MSQMTKLEIIEELFDNHFVKNPNKRGVSEFEGRPICVYYKADTRNKCAVGMCLTTKALSHIGREHFEGDVRDLDDFFSNNLDYYMKDQYRGHSLKFWTALQDLHDSPRFWTNTGLSDEGQNRLADLKKRYADSLDY
jgi:hypothetical protein